ncbi:MAG TPA: hypothetical protein VIK18_18110 [Pirellulales bacterium]
MDFSNQFQGKSNAEINRAIGVQQRNLLRRWLGTGADAAQEADANAKPANLTVDTLRAYHEIARRQIEAGLDRGGTQAARLRSIENALSNTGLP